VVNQMKAEYGLNQSLVVVDLPKSTWYYYQNHKVTDDKKYHQVKQSLKQVVREHPSYGYKRATPELNENYGHHVNKKVVLRLMRDEQLQILRMAKKPKPNTINKTLAQLGDKMNLVEVIYGEGKDIGLFEVFYTDFTEIVYDQGRKKAQLMSILEHQAKVAVGWAVGQTANTAVALAAWEKTIQTTNQINISLAGTIVHHDRGSVYTGYEWLGQLLLKDDCLVSYALRGAKDNPEMESFNGRFKDENQDLFWECRTLAELLRVVDEQMEYYNTTRRHTSLGNKAPFTYLQEKRNRRRF
jgi:putative transposase